MTFVVERTGSMNCNKYKKPLRCQSTYDASEKLLAGFGVVTITQGQQRFFIFAEQAHTSAYGKSLKPEWSFWFLSQTQGFYH